MRSFCWTSSQTWSGPAAGQQADSTKADQSQRCGVGNHGQDQIFYQTVYHHFNRWRKQAVFDRLADRLRLDADRQGLIDGSLLCADGTNIRAAASASGSRLSPPPEEPDDHALGRSRGGPRKFGSKLHVLTCGEGIGLAATLTPGQAHESKQLDPLLSKVKVGRRRRGRACAADRAYDTPACRQAVRPRGMRCVIPVNRLGKVKRWRRRGRPPSLDRQLYKRHNVVERAVGGLKRFRRLATRYEKLAVNFMAFVRLGIALQLLRRMPSDPA